MSWTGILDIAGAVAILLGAAQSLFGAIGAVRFQHLFIRMHSAAKPQTLGLLLILVGLALSLRTWAAFGTLLIVAISQALTAPIAAHMVTRAAYRAQVVRTESFEIDELNEALERAERES